jgi:hypothetical protein
VETVPHREKGSRQRQVWREMRETVGNLKYREERDYIWKPTKTRNVCSGPRESLNSVWLKESNLTLFPRRRQALY